ncbi:peptidoglycan-binding domain-containing protein [Catellatospora citrea]|uniref:peptidoglycan-binding domain-containing protein n=1 Tax=Catellatospora citrea TaxID=53366 RepID=UPI0033D4B9CE
MLKSRVGRWLAVAHRQRVRDTMQADRAAARPGVRKTFRMALVVVMATTGIGVLGVASPASAANVCTTYYKGYYYLDGVRVNDRWPAYQPCNLKQGNTGDAVKVLQYLLACNDLWTLPDGRKVARDGSFGPITREAVRLMQINLGVSADGEYGPITADAVMSRGHYPVFNGEGWWFYACN